MRDAGTLPREQRRRHTSRYEEGRLPVPGTARRPRSPPTLPFLLAMHIPTKPIVFYHAGLWHPFPRNTSEERTQLMAITNPPYAYDIVGSFLRPEALKQARADFAAGTITREQLTAAEDARSEERR